MSTLKSIKMMKSVAVILGCAISIFMFQAFTTQHQRNWENLKILPQDISKNDLDSIMDHFTASLGVKCTFCHVKNVVLDKMEFPKDDKPEKLIARKMMLLAIDINKNHFTEIEEEMHENERKEAMKISADTIEYMLQYVTCYTCHQGKERPVNTPPAKKKK